MNRFFAALAASLLSISAYADSFLIGSLAYNDSGFRYSLLHKGTGPAAMSGEVLAWIELDDTWTGSSLLTVGGADDGKAFYRDSDGRIEFRATVYPNLVFPFAEVPFGTVVVKGSGFVPGSLDGVARTLDVFGSLAWDFDLALAFGADAVRYAALTSWLGSDTESVDLHYIDRSYGALTAEGSAANGSNGTQIALWGARGILADLNATGLHLSHSPWIAAHGTHQIGNDLVIDLGGKVDDCIDVDCHVVPEPSTLILLATGLAGVLAYRRRM